MASTLIIATWSTMTRDDNYCTWRKSEYFTGEKYAKKRIKRHFMKKRIRRRFKIIRRKLKSMWKLGLLYRALPFARLPEIKRTCDDAMVLCKREWVLSKRHLGRVDFRADDKKLCRKKTQPSPARPCHELPETEFTRCYKITACSALLLALLPLWKIVRGNSLIGSLSCGARTRNTRGRRTTKWTCTCGIRSLHDD